MSKFTAGPWKVGSKFEVGKVSDADDQSFGMIDPVADVYGDNKEADARLIAAAPDLLEALQELLASYESMMHNEFDFPNDPWSAEGRNDDEAINAQKAIAKALA